MYQYPKSGFVAGCVSLAEILGSFSYALDLTEGQPEGHSVRSCWIGMQLGDAIGLDAAAQRDLFYTVLLKDLGCSANAARVSEMFLGDDRKLKHDFKLIGPDADDFGAFIMSGTGVDAAAVARHNAIANLVENAAEIMSGLIDTRCTRGADIARQLRFSEKVADAIANLDEHWDGSGLPSGKSGDAIPLGGRIALLSQIADVFFMAGGGEAARDEVAKRSGSWLDPELVEAFLSLSTAPEFWTTLGGPDIDARLFALEPAHWRVEVDDDYLDDIVMAFGQVIDAKSPFTGGHSERVSQLADAIAAEFGMAAHERSTLRRAAILHDVGKLGVSSAVLEKPGPLCPSERAAVQKHATLTFDILARVGALRHVAVIASGHHERIDGQGYPLGLKGAQIPLETRIITIADFYDALTADRPYRAAMAQEDALSIMEAEVGSAIDAECFAALKDVLAQDVPGAPLPTLPDSFQ